MVQQVWGRDDDGGGLTFTQQDMSKIVQVAGHRSEDVQMTMQLGMHMKDDHGKSILNLCIS